MITLGCITISSHLKMAIKIHPTAEVQTTKIGDGTIIWQYCVVLSKAEIGENCNINFNVFIENDVVIGNNVTIKPGVQLWDGVTVEDNVFIGPNVTFTNDLTPRSKVYPDSFCPTKIERGATLGANSTIVAGIEIGRFAMVGAGSVVTKNIPPFTLWYGNPAQHKGYVLKDGTLLDLDLKDKKGTQYKFIHGELLSND